LTGPVKGRDDLELETFEAETRKIQFSEQMEDYLSTFWVAAMEIYIKRLEVLELGNGSGEGPSVIRAKFLEKRVALTSM